jgi:hypothetical protein
MQLTKLIISTGFTLLLTPVGVIAWAQAADGTWVANNIEYPRVGSDKSR